MQRGVDMLNIEENCYWATPGTWTVTNFPCYEDGSNCVSSASAPGDRGYYVDPSVDRVPLGARLSRR